MIARDAPAQVNDRGRRRDGGLGFTIVRLARGSEDEDRVIRTLPWQIANGSKSHRISPTPSVFWNILPRTFTYFHRRRGPVCGAVFVVIMAHARKSAKAKPAIAAKRGAAKRGTARAAGAPPRADRALLLADAERLEDFDHARRVRPAVCRAADQHLQGRAIRAAAFWRSRRTIGCRPSSIPTARAGARSRCSSPAPSCNTSAARPENSIRATSARVSPSTSGCSGRWAGSARWPGRPITSAATRRRRSPTRSTATPTRSIACSAS